MIDIYSTEDVKVQIPHKLTPFLQPYRFKVAYGGRGSGKTRTIAQLLIADAISEKHLILCAREIQKSIKDSVKRVIENEIYRLGLSDEFNITNTEIKHLYTGSEFIFAGLGTNIESIKSIEGITRVWIEEAEIVSKNSLDVLIPTIREEGSEIYISFNPKFESDPVYDLFVVQETDLDVCVIEINYPDNPWFPDVLRIEMERDKKRDYEHFKWVWLGQLLKHSEDQIFYKKWKSEETPEPPHNTTLYFGADFGFFPDPATLIRCWVDMDKMNLYIDYEAYGTGVDLDELPELYETIPGSKKWFIEADSSRPDTISHVAKFGFNIRSVKKDKIEDGLSWLKNFDIIIHPRCKHTIYEFTNYRYKRDKQTNEILPIVIDKHNHLIDPLRYATRRLRGGGFFVC